MLAAAPANAQAPAPIWNGMYLGVHGGGAWGDAGSGNSPIELDGELGGLHAGYQFHSGHFVFGVEGEATFGNVAGIFSDDLSLDPILFGEPAAYSGRVDVSADVLASIKGRVGYAFGPMLVYAAGGIAWTWFDVDASVTAAGSGFSSTEGLSGGDVLTGWTVGGGAEMKFTQSISGRIDVSHYDFSDDLTDGNLQINDVDVDFTVIRVGLSFQLN